MRTIRHVLTQIFASLLLAAFFAAPAFATAERVALVIGNGTYERTADRLRNPVNDANAIARTFEDLGFQVTKALNVNQRGFYDKLSRFKRQARDAQVAVFYYAGHGVTWEDEGYLVPTDVTLRSEADVKTSIPLKNVMDSLQSETNIVFLDACRDTPMLEDLAVATGQLRSAAAALRGATRVSPEALDASNIMVVFSTTDGRPSSDGLGDNSPFTEALVAHITQPAEHFASVMHKIAASVHQLTNGKQRPDAKGVLMTDFTFVERLEVTVQINTESAQTSQDSKQPEAPQQLAMIPDQSTTTGHTKSPDVAYWNKTVKTSKDPLKLLRFITEFPESRHVPQARARLVGAINASTNPSLLQIIVDEYPGSGYGELARQRKQQLLLAMNTGAATTQSHSTGEGGKNLVFAIATPPPEKPSAHVVVPMALEPAFAAAKAAGTAQAYLDYVRANPRGRHVAEAKERAWALRMAVSGLIMNDNKVWAKYTQTKDPLYCDIYLEAFEGGEHARKARRCLADAQSSG